MELINKFQHFFNLDIKWAICGGYAIDLYLDVITRNHKDLDISVFWEDRDKIISFMLENNWRIFEPDQGRLREITSLENDLITNDNLWCLSKDNKSYEISQIDGNYYEIKPKIKNQVELDFIEFLFSNCKDDKILYKRNHNINMFIDKAIKYSKYEVPYMTPEMVLLYKASAIRYDNQNNPYDIDTIKNYQHDFDITVNKLTKEKLSWLYESLQVCYPNGHKWIDKIDDIRS